MNIIDGLTGIITKAIVEEWLWEACVAGLFGHGFGDDASDPGPLEDIGYSGFAIGDWWCEIHTGKGGGRCPEVKHIVLTWSLDQQQALADEIGCSLEDLILLYESRDEERVFAVNNLSLGFLDFMRSKLIKCAA